MKINSIQTGSFTNDEHFQFNTEFLDTVNRFGASQLKIETDFGIYLPLYGQEDTVLKKIIKSAFTAEIEEADKRRDTLFSGMVATSNAALNHFNADTRKAAARLKILFDTYGNLARKPLNQQTSGVYNLMQELNGAYAADARQVAIVDWAAELEAANVAFDRLVKDRFEESAAKTDLVLREVRREVDAAYRAIITRIGALVIVEGADAYAEFIRYWNTVIAKYAAIVAQRAGRRRKASATNPTPAEDEQQETDE